MIGTLLSERAVVLDIAAVAVAVELQQQQQ
jgi:hypothetical protein